MTKPKKDITSVYNPIPEVFVQERIVDHLNKKIGIEILKHQNYMSTE